MGVGEWGHGVGPCAYLCFFRVCTKADNVLSKGFGGQGNEAAVSKFCHRFWLVMQSSAASYTFDTKYDSLYYSTKLRKAFSFLFISLLVGAKP